MKICVQNFFDFRIRSCFQLPVRFYYRHTLILTVSQFQTQQLMTSQIRSHKVFNTFY